MNLNKNKRDLSTHVFEQTMHMYNICFITYYELPTSFDCFCHQHQGSYTRY